MRRTSQKVAISLDTGVFKRAEELRKASGESRSALVGRALRLLLADNARARDVEQYVLAYQRVPEGTPDERRARALARRSFKALAWDDT